MTNIIDSNLLLKTGLGATGIILGGALKNSSEKLPDDNLFSKYISKKNIGNFGKGLFSGGLLITASALSGTDWGTKSILSYGCFLIIFVVIITVNSYMRDGYKVPVYLPLLFSIAWLSIGYSLGILKNGIFNTNNRNIGLFSAGLIILSILFILPFQKTHCLVDGPALPLITVSGALFSLINALPNGL